MKIEAKNLIKKYNEHFNILNGISFEFDLCDRPLVIVGGDGAGKTTLCEILVGLDTEYDGEVFLDGENRHGLSLEKQKFSFILDKPLLFERKSVFENLLYVYKVGAKKFDKKVAFKEIGEVTKELGLVEILSRKVKKCTLFEKRLVSLARFSLKKSALLVVDDLFEGLVDLEKSCLLNQAILLTKKLSSGLVVSSKVENLPYFDGFNVLNLDSGAVLNENCD